MQVCTLFISQASASRGVRRPQSASLALVCFMYTHTYVYARINVVHTKRKCIKRGPPAAVCIPCFGMCCVYTHIGMHAYMWFIPKARLLHAFMSLAAICAPFSGTFHVRHREREREREHILIYACVHCSGIFCERERERVCVCVCILMSSQASIFASRD